MSRAMTIVTGQIYNTEYNEQTGTRKTQEPALIDVLGRTPALAHAVSRLLPFLTYGTKAAAGLLADKFAQVCASSSNTYMPACRGSLSEERRDRVLASLAAHRTAPQRIASQRLEHGPVVPAASKQTPEHSALTSLCVASATHRFDAARPIAPASAPPSRLDRRWCAGKTS